MDKIIVVGAGISGLLSALELSEAGYEVSILDQSDFGRESSWAGGGIISPLYPWEYPEAINQLAALSQHYYPTLVKRLYEATDIDPEYRESGMLFLDQDEDGPGYRWAQTQAQLRYQLLDGAALHAAEPGLKTALPHALLFENRAQVRNPRLLKAVIQVLKNKNVKLLSRSSVEQVLVRHNEVRGVKTNQGEILAPHVLICAGAWSGQSGLFEQAKTIYPVQGQMLLYRIAANTLRHVILDQGRYIIPRADGRVLVGSTMEPRGFDKQITQQAFKALNEFACSHFPVLENQLETHWAGLRPATDDHLPVIGPHPSIHGLYINAGHFRNGVVMAPASARLILNIIAKQPTILDPTAFAPRLKKQN